MVKISIIRYQNANLIARQLQIGVWINHIMLWEDLNLYFNVPVVHNIVEEKQKRWPALSESNASIYVHSWSRFLKPIQAGKETYSAYSWFH